MFILHVTIVTIKLIFVAPNWPLFISGVPYTLVAYYFYLNIFACFYLIKIRNYLSFTQNSKLFKIMFKTKCVETVTQC